MDLYAKAYSYPVGVEREIFIEDADEALYWKLYTRLKTAYAAFSTCPSDASYDAFAVAVQQWTECRRAILADSESCILDRDTRLC
jgi:hypothetical protein